MNTKRFFALFLALVLCLGLAAIFGWLSKKTTPDTVKK